MLLKSEVKYPERASGLRSRWLASHCEGARIRLCSEDHSHEKLLLRGRCDRRHRAVLWSGGVSEVRLEVEPLQPEAFRTGICFGGLLSRSDPPVENHRILGF